MFKRTVGIRARVLVIAFVPSVALFGIGVGTAGYLLNESHNSHDWLQVLSSASGTSREMVAAFEQERMLSLWQLAGEQPDPVGLAQARQRVDNALRAIAPTQKAINDKFANRMAYDTGSFDTLQKMLPNIRAAVDAGAMAIPDVYSLYTRILDGVVTGSQVVMEGSPSVTSTLETDKGVRVLLAMESMARSASLTAAVLNGQTLPSALMAEYRDNVGFYHAELPRLVHQLAGSESQAAAAIIASPAWQQLSAMEDYIIHPPAPAKAGGPTPPPPLSVADWRAAYDQLTRQVLDLWLKQSSRGTDAALVAVNKTTQNSLLAGGGALLVSLAAFVVALWLANRLIRRLKRLRTETLSLAEDRLPELMRRLAAGDDIDVEAEAAQLDFGSDEVGAVARAFNRAHTAAVSAAITEARTREGVRAVFLNIAHRSQVVVHRLLEILDDAESRQEDPVMLDTLFRMDHLATRERRNAENLVILGGGQPGRQWRRPVPLVEVVRSAVGETLDYARVRTSRMPPTHIVGAGVADLIHLLAELIDNASAFSPPESRVDITGAVVGKGVVIEITDQGMGIPSDAMQRSNEMLRQPPDFGVATLSADSRLGLFVVAQLANRHGISVRLTDSDYGGVRAIVLVPTTLIAAESMVVDHLPDRFTRIPDPPMTGEMPAVAALTPVAAPVAAGFASLPVAEQFSPPPPEPPRRAPAGPHHVPPAPHSAPAAPHNPPTVSRNGYPTRPPLPRRRKQASLAPELAEQRTTEAGSQRPRSAEQARDLMSAINNGTRQGRRVVEDATAAVRPEEQEGEGDLFPRR
ncbi:sensor histidine kinase [Nocardia sp. alder85J]|uniref:sensor histidine kinase n=1 Tax=Nocardia sp. alder85J TaxID=2862949 RepID=UPI001CD5E006|nr:sensor histidine kinase [Nocardia sp. alder85J]MCX4091866.1 sensor histidine kinase [Nocardia sp. alder85J]